jgi:predicted Zn-dependent protease
MSPSHRVSSRAALGLAVAIAAAACSAQQRIKTETAIARVLVSDEQEAQLGAQFQQELDKKGIRYVTDAAVTSYVLGVANRVLAPARRDRPQVSWDVRIIDDPKQVNAFAVPGGHLYVFSGLLLEAEDESQLAGVWGHEAGHVVARHTARQMVDAYGLEMVVAMALGQNPSLVEKLTASVLANGAMLANSRADEYEADTYGVRYASAAGYDPHGIVRFFQRLMAMEGRAPRALTWLSDHPATGDRIARTEKYIAAHRLAGTDTGQGRLEGIKARLRAQASATGTSGAPPPPPPAH